jgi:transcriptional regulator with XRE-family HTH domain
MEPLNERIKRIRLTKKIRQEDLAESVGLSRLAMNKIENGTTKKIFLDVAVAISKALDCSFTDLFDVPTHNGPNDRLTEDVSKLEQKLSELENLHDLLQTKIKNQGRLNAITFLNNHLWSMNFIDRLYRSVNDTGLKTEFESGKTELIEHQKRSLQDAITNKIFGPDDFHSAVEGLKDCGISDFHGLDVLPSSQTC